MKHGECMATGRTVTSLTLFVVLALAGCGCMKADVRPDPSQLEFPAYSQLAEVHNARVAMLRRWHSRGVAELRWRDERGERREPQADIDLYVDLPGRTALRVSKLGTVYLWVGSNGPRYWLFDFLGDERVAYVGRFADGSSMGSESGVIAVGPMALLDLFALTPLPVLPNDEQDSAVTYDAEHDAWRVEAMGAGGPIAIYFDRVSQSPVRVECMDGAGGVAYYSRIYKDRYLSVPMPGISAATPPRMPGLVDVYALDETGEVTGWLKLALDAPTGHVDEGPMNRVFDLETLMRALRPDVVHDTSAGAASP